ncbi:MAG TPA: hypothetical protein VL354_12870 [Spirochaetia bacterium]|nr:hypothetical protein [Spirochaetia bacterium]
MGRRPGGRVSGSGTAIHVWRVHGGRKKVAACVGALVSQHTGCRVEDIHFTHGRYGKPLHPAIHFNVSHSGGLALIALSPDRRVGVDIEKHRDDVDVRLIAQDFLRLSSVPTVEDFFALWTRREAEVKARGGSILLGRPAGRPWRIVDLPTGRGYSAALCYSGQEAEVFLREYTL